MTRASSKPSDPILIAGLLPPPVVQAPNSTSIDAPRASMRVSRMGQVPPSSPDIWPAGLADYTGVRRYRVQALGIRRSGGSRISRRHQAGRREAALHEREDDLDGREEDADEDDRGPHHRVVELGVALDEVPPQPW